MTDTAHDESCEGTAIRVNITLPPDVDDLLKQRAKSERRSKSAHVAWLVEQDAERAKAAKAEAAA